MPIRPRCNVVKASNYPEQKLLTELELLEQLESHYNGKPAARIYLAPHCYIIPEFYRHALQGMLASLEEKEAYEACARILKLLNLKESLLP